MKRNNKRPERISPEENLKYISRSFYYGKLTDWEYTEQGAMVLKMAVYTATTYYGNTSTVRVYVPTDMENDLMDKLITGDNYLIITSPYRVKLSKGYQHRVDLLLNIFKEL